MRFSGLDLFTRSFGGDCAGGKFVIFQKVNSEFGKLDIFVSNARPEVPTFFQPPLAITLEQWNTAFDSQANAFLVGVREAVSLMGDSGRIFTRLLMPKEAVPVDCNRG